MANLEVLRKVVLGRGSTSPPRTAGTTCDEAGDPVVLELGKGPVGKVVQVSDTLDVTGYMTKQQKEQEPE